MRQLIGSAFLSLDGVIQAPGAPSEDRSGGFALGGWLPAFADDAMGEALGKLFTPPFDLVLGRRTYDIFAAYWPFYKGSDDAEIAAQLNAATKYVVTSGNQPLTWGPSHRVADIDAIAELKQGDGPNLIIQGSSTLYPQLLAAGLIDRLTLLTFPVILGSGKRLFGDGTPPGTMRMVEHTVSKTGNVIATYEAAGKVETGSFGWEEPSPLELERRRKVEEGTW